MPVGATQLHQQVALPPPALGNARTGVRNRIAADGGDLHDCLVHQLLEGQALASADLFDLGNPPVCISTLLQLDDLFGQLLDALAVLRPVALVGLARLPQCQHHALFEVGERVAPVLGRELPAQRLPLGLGGAVEHLLDLVLDRARPIASEALRDLLGELVVAGLHHLAQPLGELAGVTGELGLHVVDLGRRTLPLEHPHPDLDRVPNRGGGLAAAVGSLAHDAGGALVLDHQLFDHKPVVDDPDRAGVIAFGDL